MASMHYSPPAMNHSYDPVYAAAQAGPSNYAHTSPQTQAVTQDSSAFQPYSDWDLYESAEGTYTGGTSPGGSSVGTPVSDAALSHPYIAGGESYAPEQTLGYGHESWPNGAQPQVPQQPLQQKTTTSSLHGALGDYTYDATAPLRFDAGITQQHQQQQPYHAAMYAGPTTSYYYHHSPPVVAPQAEAFTEQRTTTVSYTVNVTTTRTPYSAPAYTAPAQQAQHQQLPSIAQAYTVQPLHQAVAHAHPHSQAHHAHSHHHHRWHHQQHYPHPYVPARSHPHGCLCLAPISQHQQPVHSAPAFAPTFPPMNTIPQPELYQPKPVHPLPEWTQPAAFDAVPYPSEEPTMYGNSPVQQAYVEEVPSEDGDEEEEGDDDEAMEEAEIAPPLSAGSLPAGSLLCQPIAASVRAQFEFPRQVGSHAPQAPAAYYG